MGDAQAALGRLELAAGRLDDLRVDEGEADVRLALLLVVGGDVDGDQPQHDPDLGRGEAHAGRVEHRLHHVGGQLAQARVDAPDLVRLLPQAGVALGDDLQHRHRSPLNPCAAGPIRSYSTAPWPRR